MIRFGLCYFHGSPAVRRSLFIHLSNCCQGQQADGDDDDDDDRILAATVGSNTTICLD